MKVQSVNPFNEKVLAEYDVWDDAAIEKGIERSQFAYKEWRQCSRRERLDRILALGGVLDAHKEEWAALISDEMGKTLKEARAEIEKCADACRFFSEHLDSWLASTKVEAPSGHWEVVYEPMGVLVGVMPWNFPFWQVFRFALPALGLGNTILLKHASNVFGCSEAIHSAFREAGFPGGVFQHAPLKAEQVSKLLKDFRVRGVSLTGSMAAGRSIGELAGKYLKKMVLELGGSDPYVILDDADLELAVEKCVTSRLLNAGQSCVCAKRFIVTKKNSAEFSERFIEKMKHKTFGDPKDPKTDIGPLSRMDLRNELHAQVEASIKGGARLALGGSIPKQAGAFYPPTVLLGVDASNIAFREETFGPVAAIIEAASDDQAILLANQSSYGLGSAVFSRDLTRALEIARHHMEAGLVFVNDFVKSDPRIPFGGVKDSGVGRELGQHGVLEFANIKSVVAT